MVIFWVIGLIFFLVKIWFCVCFEGVNGLYFFSIGFDENGIRGINCEVFIKVCGCSLGV